MELLRMGPAPARTTLRTRPSPAAAERAALEARQPTGGLVTAEQVTHAVAYLANPLARATTGTVLDADGGVMGVGLPAAPAS